MVATILQILHYSLAQFMAFNVLNKNLHLELEM